MIPEVEVIYLVYEIVIVFLILKKKKKTQNKLSTSFKPKHTFLQQWKYNIDRTNLFK